MIGSAVDPAASLRSKAQIGRRPECYRAQQEVGSSRPQSRIIAEVAHQRQSKVHSSSRPSKYKVPSRICMQSAESGFLWLLLALTLVVALPHLAEAGKCVQPPKGGTAFCQIDYQVYVSADTANNDTDYW